MAKAGRTGDKRVADSGQAGPKHAGERSARSGKRSAPSRWHAMATSAPARDTSGDVREAEAFTVAKQILGSATVPSNLDLASASDPGETPSRVESPPAQARAPVEDLLGHDFSGVRVHTGEAAAELTRREHAHAVTSGADIYFAPGRYRPDHPLGRAVVAHELTHVAQQRAAPRRNRVTGHLHALRGGATPAIADYERSAAGFHAANDARSLANQADAIRDRHPSASLTPAPGGMHQKWGDGGKESEQKREQEEEPPAEVPEEIDLAPPLDKDAPPAQKKQETPEERQKRIFGESGSTTIDALRKWLEDQKKVYEGKIVQKKQKYKEKGWAEPTEKDLKDYTDRITKLDSLLTELNSALGSVSSNGADVLTLANVVWNEANAHPDGMPAVAYAWLNRTGGTVREPVGAEISHYKTLSDRWAAFTTDTERLAFLVSFIPALRAAIARLNDAKPATNDPTSGSKHWVSPGGLPAYDSKKHSKDRYKRTVGTAKDKAFPNWAIANDDTERLKKAKADGIIDSATYQERTVTGVPKEDFLFYTGVK